MRPSLITALVTVVAAAGCGTAAGRTASPGRPWRVAYDGYGHVVQSSRAGVTHITLVPATPASAGDTHAALVLSRRSWWDLALEVRVRTNAQLRRPHPNPWEMGWLLWHYRSDQRFYFIILKPNGWELGKQDPAYPGNQRFLATGRRPAFSVGRWYTVGVRQHGDVITVNVDGDRLVRFTDTQHPYRSGQVGLYTEDASATFQPVTIHTVP